MLKNLKNNKKKGFTLVELIVVLVILAILAALLIPALTGYIDKAKNKSIVAETRQAVMAAQTLVDEAYAKADVGADTVKIEDGTGADGTGVTVINKSDIAALAEVKAANIQAGAEVTNGKVTKFVYKKSGRTCTYDPNRDITATGSALATGETQDGAYFVKK